MQDLQSRMQDLTLELQEVSQHSNSRTPDDDDVANDGDQQDALFCPDASCKEKQTYTKFRSLQRHYQSRNTPKSSTYPVPVANVYCTQMSSAA